MRSYVRDLTKTVNTLKFSKVNVLGVVLNDFKRTGKKVVGYKNYYEEKYSYGYGSDEGVEALKSGTKELDEKSEE